MKEETKIKPKIGLEINGEQYNYKVFESLKIIIKDSFFKKNSIRIKYFSFCIR